MRRPLLQLYLFVSRNYFPVLWKPHLCEQRSFRYALILLDCLIYQFCQLCLELLEFFIGQQVTEGNYDRKEIPFAVYVLASFFGNPKLSMKWKISFANPSSSITRCLSFSFWICCSYVINGFGIKLPQKQRREPPQELPRSQASQAVAT